MADPPKKRKQDEEDASHPDFSDFKVCKVLSEDSRTKTLFLHGQLEGSDAVVLLEKSPFIAANVSDVISDHSSFTQTLNNDIYSTYEVDPPPKTNGVKMTLIHPATQKHITKYTYQAMFIVEETAQLYKTVTLPYITEQNFSIQWVYNILEKKTEADRIVYEDPDTENGFILLPDMKWDRKDSSKLYLVAIAHRKEIKSLRDLTAEHLPLLKNMLHKSRVAIQDKFGVPAHQLRVYIHYQPSYYHLHVHFTHIKLDVPGFEADRAHPITDVLQNIEIDPNYYSNKTLVFKVRENDGLYKAFQKANYFTETENSSCQDT